MRAENGGRHVQRIEKKESAVIGNGSQEYFDTVVNQVEAFIPDDCEYLGAFMCAGKMPPQILEKYKQMQKVNDNPQVRMMI